MNYKIHFFNIFQLFRQSEFNKKMKSVYIFKTFVH